jgi:phosphatidylinositol 3-kinase
MSWRVFREDIDPENLKPSKDEAEQMIRLIRSPLIEEMKSEQKVLFFRYRYYLLRTQP